MKKKIFWVGVWTIVGILILYIGLNFLKGVGIFSSTRTYYARFTEVSNLSVASPVFVRGYKVGNVQEMKLEKDGVWIAVRIGKDIQLPVGTEAVMEQTLMSGAQLNLVLPQEVRGYLQDGDTLVASSPEKDMINKLGTDVLPMLMQAMPKVDSVLHNLNRLLQHQQIDPILANVERSTQHLDRLILKAHSVAEQLPSTIQLLKDVMKDVKGFSSQLEAVRIAQTIERLEQTSQEIQQLTQKLQSPNGTLGKLIEDPSVYNKMDSLLQTTDILIKDIRQNPKRYINLSIF